MNVRNLKDGEWFWIPKYVMERKIPKRAKLVYMALSYFANSKTQTAFPQLKTIAKLASIGKKSVIGAVKDLEKSGLLSVSRVAGKVNFYKLNAIKLSTTSTQIATGGGAILTPNQYPNSTTNKNKEQELYNNQDFLKKDYEENSSNPIYRDWCITDQSIPFKKFVNTQLRLEAKHKLRAKTKGLVKTI